jgi:ParB/RepB/Spo0J family partition protein
VAGERRWRASTRLAERRGEVGVAVVPCIVRDMDDFEVLELATVENLQREGLHPLEEAEGYEALLRKPVAGGEFSPPRIRGYTVDELAARVGKSRGYVFGRLKLLALVPEAREAFYGDQISASVALQLARLAASIQTKALPEILRGWGGEPLSARATFDLLHRRFMLRLAQAPFDTGSDFLLPAAGACSTCPKRTGVNPDLWGDVKEHDTCTDPDCHGAKVTAHWQQLVELARDKQVDIVDDPAEIREYMPYGTDWSLCQTDHVDLGDEDSELADRLTQGRTPREALGDAVWRIAGLALLLRDPDNLADKPPLLVAKEAHVEAALKRAGKLRPDPEDDGADEDADDDSLHGGDWKQPEAKKPAATAAQLKARIEHLGKPETRASRIDETLVRLLPQHIVDTAPSDRLQPIDLPRPYLLHLANALTFGDLEVRAVIEALGQARPGAEFGSLRNDLDKLPDDDLGAFIQVGAFMERYIELVASSHDVAAYDDYLGDGTRLAGAIESHPELGAMAEHLGLDLTEAVPHIVDQVDTDIRTELATLEEQLAALTTAKAAAGAEKPAKKGGKKKPADATEAFVAAHSDTP